MANEQEIQVVKVQSATNDLDSVITQVPVRTIADLKIGYDVLRYIPEESAEHYKIAPLSVTDGVLEVGMLNPENIEGIDALNFIAKATGTPFKVFRISQADFDTVLKMYRGLSGDVDRAVSELQVEQDGNTKAKNSTDDSEDLLLDLDDPAL